MEELLRQILAELQYHTKLLEGFNDLLEEGKQGRNEDQKSMKQNLDKLFNTIFESPHLKGRPEVAELKKKVNMGG